MDRWKLSRILESFLEPHGDGSRDSGEILRDVCLSKLFQMTVTDTHFKIQHSQRDQELGSEPEQPDIDSYLVSQRFLALSLQCKIFQARLSNETMSI